MRTLTSVTGLIHAYSAPFDASKVADQMMNGKNWPRVGYLKVPLPQEPLSFLGLSGVSGQALVASDLEEHTLCVALRSQRHQGPEQ